ncbi:hypothetical protein BKA65DRAFT_143372 [Rhexocercosporidium sp. MPI-PUGE-AT-0058]|nr:hypothetical protein BKA65DRAFT_143372 [Rhexocercosporidium sp. MPI-PUGE-AT-0058]
MDPLTCIGAVASICQLAHAALSLSKTLYSLGSAIGSASEDVQVLAEDLKTFSQSLTLLSRLLEDSKSWYSDDIYLLTAKIIKDCAELYVKIEKILAKLGGNGKSNWKLRVKFVYKEDEIRKLLKRLRDMKGTLATILMSLQVDLQLSLLNLSSTNGLGSSKAQNASDVSLQPETLQTLKEAQKAVDSRGFMARYSAPSKQAVEFSEKGVRISSTHREEVNQRQPAVPCGIASKSPKSHQDASSKGLDHRHRQPTNAVNVPQCLMMIPSDSANMQNVFARKNVSRAVINEYPDSSSGLKSAASQTLSGSIAPASTDADMKSLKSSSSVESFKSAKSIQEEELEVARKVKSIQSVLHAFRSALEVLHILMERRIEDRRWDLYTSATQLKASLVDGRDHIDRRNIYHFKQHGTDYINYIYGEHSAEVHRLGSVLMQDVGLKLHEYTAEHEELESSFFEKLSTSTADVERQILEHLDIVADLASKTVNPGPCTGYYSHRFMPSPKPTLPPPTRWQYTRTQPEETSHTTPVAISDPTSPTFSPASPGYSPTSPAIVQVSLPQPRPSTSNSHSSDGSAIVNYYNPNLPSKWTRESVPPPFPPPRQLSTIASDGHAGPEIAWKWGNSHEDCSAPIIPSLSPRNIPTQTQSGRLINNVSRKNSTRGENPPYSPSNASIMRPKEAQEQGEELIGLGSVTPAVPASFQPYFHSGSIFSYERDMESDENSAPLKRITITTYRSPAEKKELAQKSTPSSEGDISGHHPAPESKDPELPFGNAYLPLDTCPGLNDAQHQRATSFHSDTSYPLTRFRSMLRTHSESGLAQLREREQSYLRQSPLVKAQRQAYGSGVQSPLIDQATRQHKNGSRIPSPPPIRSSTRYQYLDLGALKGTPGSFDFQDGLEFANPCGANADTLEDFDFHSFLDGGYDTRFDYGQQNIHTFGETDTKTRLPVKTQKSPSQNWTINTKCESCLKSDDSKCDGASTSSRCATSGQLCVYPSRPKAPPSGAALLSNAVGDSVMTESPEPNPPVLKNLEAHRVPSLFFEGFSERSVDTNSYISAFKEEDMEVDMPLLGSSATPSLPRPMDQATLFRGPKNLWWSSFKGSGSESRNAESKNHFRSEGEPYPPSGISAPAQNLKHGVEGVDDQGLDAERADDSASGRRRLRRKIGDFESSPNVPETQEPVSAKSHVKKQRYSPEGACFECQRRKQKCNKTRDRPCDQCARQYPPIKCFYKDSNEPSRYPTAISLPGPKDYDEELLLFEMSNTTKEASLLPISNHRSESGNGTTVMERGTYQPMEPSTTPPPQVPAFPSPNVHGGTSIIAVQTSVSGPVSNAAEKRRREVLAKKEKLRELRRTRQGRAVTPARRNSLSELDSAQKAPSGQYRGWTSITDSTMQRSEVESLMDEVPTTPTRPSFSYEMAQTSNPVHTHPPGGANHNLQDYQMQLMLLEQQNKKRRMIVRQAMDNQAFSLSGNANPSVGPPSSLTSAIEAGNHLTESVLPIREQPHSCETILENKPRVRTRPSDQFHQQQQAQAVANIQNQRNQQNSNRDQMSKNEKTADEAVTILLKLDPDRKFKSPVQSSDADQKALADYQMSLMTNMNCRQNPKREMMYRADGIDAKKRAPTHIRNPILQIERGAGLSSSSHGHGHPPPERRDHAMYDVLQDFDFDSFLQQGESSGDFNFDPPVFSHETRYMIGPSSTGPDSPSLNMASAPADIKEKPLYINNKQFHRILKRRVARQHLEKQLVSGEPSTLTPELPSRQASNRDLSSLRTEEHSARGEEVPDYLSHGTRMKRESSDGLPLRVKYAEDDLYSAEDDLYSAEDIATKVPMDAQKLKLAKTNFNLAAGQVVTRPSGPAVPPPPSAPLSSKPNNSRDIELAWSHPMLSPAQNSRLWWQAYISCIAASAPQSPVFTILNSALQSEMGLSPYQCPSDEEICRRVVDLVRPLGIAGSTLHEDRPELRDLLILRGDIVRILMTVDARLGLQTATLGWSCVSVFLNIFGQVLNSNSPLCPSAISILETTFSHLQEIVHIIARYAVMENLYQQSIANGTNTTLSLKPEYQSSLLSLCSSILEWFAVSYGIGRIVIGTSSGELAGVGALAVLGELDEKMRECGVMMGVVTEKNMGCRIFRVEVDVSGEEGSEVDGESEDADTDVDGVSDASWEEIGEDDIMASVGVE